MTRFWNNLKGPEQDNKNQFWSHVPERELLF
jgi:hypothetical protein